MRIRVKIKCVDEYKLDGGYLSYAVMTCLCHTGQIDYFHYSLYSITFFEKYIGKVVDIGVYIRESPVKKIHGYLKSIKFITPCDSVGILRFRRGTEV